MLGDQCLSSRFSSFRPLDGPKALDPPHCVRGGRRGQSCQVHVRVRAHGAHSCTPAQEHTPALSVGTHIFPTHSTHACIRVHTHVSTRREGALPGSRGRADPRGPRPRASPSGGRSSGSQRAKRRQMMSSHTGRLGLFVTLRSDKCPTTHRPWQGKRVTGVGAHLPRSLETSACSPGLACSPRTDRRAAGEKGSPGAQSP